MPSVNDLSESKYVAKEDVGKGKLVTITGFKQVDVSKDSEPASMKYILSFDECKPLVLNKTNGKRIAKIMHEVYSVTRDYNDDGVPMNEDFVSWTGKKIILWNNPDIEFQGEQTGGIRVREPEQAPQVTGGMTQPQQQQYDRSSQTLEEEAESAKQFAEDNDLGDIEGEGQQH